MRLLIKFAKEFEHDDIEKDVDSHETIDNLSVLISLTIPEFNTYDLYYRNMKLSNPKLRLGDVIDVNQLEHQIRVVKKGASVLMMNQARAFKDNITSNIKLDGAQGAGSKILPFAIGILLLIIVFSYLS